MPIFKENQPLGAIKREFNKGNLVVRFDIQFPSKLSEQQRIDITKVLDEATE